MMVGVRVSGEVECEERGRGSEREGEEGGE